MLYSAVCAFIFHFQPILNENKWLDSEMFLILALQPRQPPEEVRSSWNLTRMRNQLIGVRNQLIGVSNQLTGVSNQLTGVSNQLTGGELSADWCE